MDNERSNYLLSYAEQENSRLELLGEKLSHIICSVISCTFKYSLKYSRCFHWFREITLWAIYGINARVSPTRQLWKPKLIKNVWKSCWLANKRGRRKGEGGSDISSSNMKKGYQYDVMFQLAHHFWLNIFIKMPALDFNALQCRLFLFWGHPRE